MTAVTNPKGGHEHTSLTMREMVVKADRSDLQVHCNGSNALKLCTKKQ